MKNIIYITSEDIPESEYAAFIDTRHGYWSKGFDPQQAVLSDNNANLYLTLFKDFSDEWSPDELHELSETLGAFPKTGIDIHIGHGEGSMDLAESVSNLLILEWGGIVIPS